jgi:transposase
MGRTPIRAKLVLDTEARSKLETIAKSRTEGQARIERAKVLLAYHAGERVTALAEGFQTNRPKIERILNRALEMGALASLEDRPGRGRKPEITAEARAWLMAVACTKPIDLGYPEELWATRTLALHARKHGPEAGHPCLAKLGRGTVSKLLTGAELRPHKIEYYLERRDPEFDTKMAQILMVYREVQVLQEKLQSGDKAETDEGQLMAVLSLDEKPGIQAIGKVAPDLPPVPGKHPSNGRDYEYKRHGTLSLLAGLDLLTGKVHACIEERHRSLEFTKLLEQIHQAYSAETRILIVLSLDALVCAAGTGGQPFSPHLEGNPGLPQDAAQPLRVRVHAQARVLVEPGGSLFRQDDQDHPQGDPGGLEG